MTDQAAIASFKEQAIETDLSAAATKDAGDHPTIPIQASSLERLVLLQNILSYAAA